MHPIGAHDDAADSRQSIERWLCHARDVLGLDLVLLRHDAGSPRDADLDSRGASLRTLPVTGRYGELHGTLHCTGVRPQRQLGARDLQLMVFMATAIGDELDRAAVRRERQRTRRESEGVAAVLAAIEAHDPYTGDHSRAVVRLTRLVAHELRLAPGERRHVEHVALLHDVGKVAVPDEILQKPDLLSDAEMAMVRRHPAVGAEIVESIAGLEHLATAIRAGHERWDGFGYPDGIAGDAIPLESRITLVCDAYDAMTSDRPYRSSIAPAAAVAELRAGAGSQFCPRCVDALVAALARTEPAVAGAEARRFTRAPALASG